MTFSPQLPLLTISAASAFAANEIVMLLTLSALSAAAEPAAMQADSAMQSVFFANKFILFCPFPLKIFCLKYKKPTSTKKPMAVFLTICDFFVFKMA